MQTLIVSSQLNVASVMSRYMIRMAHLVSGSLFGPTSFFCSGREALGDANFVLAISKEGGESALASRPYDLRLLFTINWKSDSCRSIRIRRPRHVKHSPWSRVYMRVAFATDHWQDCRSPLKRPYDTYKMAFHIDELSIYSEAFGPPYIFLWMVCRGSGNFRWKG
jgi:hypothetical protein